MPQQSEDKAIMLARASLEQYWLTQLSGADQAAWLAHWATRKPHDAYGRTYDVTVRTSLQTTIRPPETIYAWSQIFGTYRFNLPPVTTPTSATEIGVLISWHTLTATAQIVTVDSYTDPAESGYVLIYMSGCVSPSARNIVKQMQYMSAWVLVLPGAQIDVSAVWAARYQAISGLTVYAQAYTVNSNNELSSAEDPIAAIMP